MNMVDRVEAVDDTTVRFYLNAPTIDFPAYTSLGWFLIVAHDRTAEQLATEPSGTGPFRFSEQRAGEQTTMVRNEAYWNAPRPYLDELRFVYIADAAARIEALRSNIVDVIWQIEPEVVAALEQNADLQVIKTPSGEHNSLVMDVTSAPFDDVRVRQAFKHCVDREGMVQAVLQGYGVAGNDQPVAPNDPAWADIAPLAYDPARAKALLAEAGYPDGLEITLATSDSRPGMVPMAVAFQEMAKPAGITVAIERHPGETYWTEVFMQTNFFTSKWSVFANADMLLHMGYRSDGAWLETGIQDPALDALISEVRSEADPAQRQAMYREIQELISYEGGEIIPYFKSLLSTAHAKVQGVQMLTTSWMYFDETWLTTA
ncbi:MAG: ABC transporter substrate-binding protein [Chloroflexia bacterium]|nr:ABC transporter substrate-binding protein [Chloroflexia bacterium]